VRLSVCAQQIDQSDIWALNAYSYKTVKATHFKFDRSIPNDSQDMTP